MLIRRILLLAAALFCLIDRPAAAAVSWVSAWNPLMPAAVYFDGKSYIWASVPTQGWPWPNGAMDYAASRGTLVVWLKPDYRTDGLNGGKSYTWSPIETAPLYNRKDGGGEGEALSIDIKDTGQLSYDQITGFFYKSSNPTCTDDGNGVCGGFQTLDGQPHLVHSIWQPLMIAWDTEKMIFKVRVDRSNVINVGYWGVNAGAGFSVNTVSVQDINFFVSQLRYQEDGVWLPYKGGASEMWIKFGVFIDPDLHGDLFVDDTLHQVFLGEHGERPLEALGLHGQEPDFYFAAPNLFSQWGCNMSGGAHTAVVGPQPPRIPGPNAVISVDWIPLQTGPLPLFPQMRTIGSC